MSLRLLAFLFACALPAAAGPKWPKGLGGLLKSAEEAVEKRQEGSEQSSESDRQAEPQEPAPEPPAALNKLLKRAGVSQRDVQRIQKGVKTAKKTKAVADKSFSEITPDEEHFIGRAVSAEVFARQHGVADEELNRYVQAVGQAVAAASDRPETFSGYHFQVLDAGEVNAMSAMGGFVFITSGLLSRLESEDELACVLGHEIAHVSAGHGIDAVRKSRKLKGTLEIASTASSALGADPAAARRLDLLRGNAKAFMDVLLVTGYGHDKEFEADERGAAFAQRAGYDPGALASAIEKVEGSGAPKGGLFKTHPRFGERVERLRGAALQPVAYYRPSKARERRFAAYARR